MQIAKGVQWVVRIFLLLLIIALGSNYLIRFVLSRPPKAPTISKTEPKEKPANEAAFQSALAAGNQALQNGEYTNALDRFLEAESSAPLLTDEQYEALKSARLQLAKIYESAGERSETENVYRLLAAYATRQAQAFYDQKQYKPAAVRAQDAEEFCAHLTEDKRDALQSAIYYEASSLRILQRYTEAEDAQLRLIDYLKASVDDSDPYFAQAYMTLAGTYADAKDWAGLERALHQVIESCDRANAKQNWSGLPIVKNWAEYNLVIAYYREGDPDTALSKADEFFTAYSNAQPDPMHPVNVAYHPHEFASLALQIASEAKMPVAVDLWKRRGGVLSGQVNVIALRPTSQ
jgi:tetratricopeptide (TPR) repeat protein